MPKIRTCLGLSLLSVLLACGGGGGGDAGGPPPSSGFRVSLDRSSVSFDFEEGQTVTPAVVIASSSGTPSGDLYIGAVAEGEGIDPYIDAVIEGTQARFSLRPRASLAPGNYSGRVLLKACEDAACTRTIGGTPLPVSYTVKVRKGLTVTPSELNIVAVSGNEASAVLKVNHPDGPGGSFSDTVRSDGAWLRTGVHGIGELPVTLKSLRSGTYFGNIEIRASGRLVNVPVRYTVTPPPGGDRDLQVSPQSLSLATTENASSTAQTLNVTLPSWGDTTLGIYTAYQQANGEYVQSSGGWLSVQRTANGASVVASATALSQGSYNAQILFNPAAPGTPIVVPVSLTVGAGLVKPADQQLSVTAETSSSALQGQVAIALAAGNTVAWSASSDATWLKLLNASGQTGQALRYQVDSSALDSMTNFAESEATVTVRAPQTQISPVSFKVSLRKAIPEVHYVGPYLLVQNQAAEVHVRGRGFDQVQNLAARLQLSGLAASQISRLSDTQLLLSVNPTNTGKHVIGIGNALGLGSGSTELRVIAARSYPAAALATAGKKRTILFDAERQTVYAVNVEGETLDRMRFDAQAGWSLDSVSIPAILDAGIGPDGQQLLVSSKSGSLRLLNAANLQTEFSLQSSESLLESLTYLSNGIPTGNDGRAWLAVGQSWAELQYFDHRSRSLKPRPQQAELSTSFYGGPWMVMARNGERMLVVQSASISSDPPMLYLDSSEGLLKTNPAALTFSYDMQLSADGNRVLFDFSTVRDRNFGLIGQLPSLPSTHVVQAGLISPDGKRAYVLAYADSDMGNFDQAPTQLPRVFVYDSSQASSGSIALSEVGQFDLSAYPGCRRTDGSCPRPRATISPDGQTLFVVGNEKLVVAPIPSALRSSTGARRIGAAGTPTLRTYLWRKSAP